MNASILIGLFLMMLSFQEQDVTIFLIGDSTVADKPYQNGNPEKGWGQVFPLYLKEGVRIENHAVNGRSTKSFIDEGRWEVVLSKLGPGDYVFVEFGHNDAKKDDPKRFADPETAYRKNLVKFIEETRKKGATPVLITPIVRRRFDDSGKFYDTHGRYPEVVREVANAKNVPLIDLHDKTRELLRTYGEERSMDLFLHILPGEYPSRPEGVADDTHLSAAGAFRVCDLVVAEMRQVLPELTEYLNE